jgi:CheY-like chemotaxis protein
MPGTNSRKILAVDDEQEFLTYLAAILRRADYNVITALSGKEAVNLSIEHKPDLILLDIVLPDLDGGEVASILSKNPSTASIPIIFITGILRKKEESLASKDGKHFIIAKPVDAGILLAAIERIIPR